jgi:hypothetical protein
VPFKVIPIPNQMCSYAYFGIGMRGRMPRRNAKHFERQEETAFSAAADTSKPHGRGFDVESE